MNGVRNLKLGEQWGKDQGTGDKTFCVWANCRSYSVIACRR